MRWLVLALVAPALVGCRHAAPSGEAGAKSEPAKPVAVEITTAVTRPITVTVTATGTLAPAQGATARVATPIAGRLVDVRVREGDRVRAGQILALIDNRPQQAQAKSAAAAVTTSESQARQSELAARAAAIDQSNAVRQARLALDSARLDRENSLTQARTSLASAETDLRKLRAAARPQVAQAEQAVNQAQATRDRAATEVVRVQFLFDKGISARRQLEDAKTALVVADAALASAKEQAALVRAGAGGEDLRAAELRVQAAREAQAQAQTSGDAKAQQAAAALRQAEQSALQVSVRQQEARAMRQTVAQKRADLAAAQAIAGYAALSAPLNGTVTRRALNPGDMADPAAPVVEVTDTRTLNLLANLPAGDGAKVRAGMRAQVRATDLPGRVFTGWVLSVGQVDPQTNLLAVRVAVANVAGTLKIGAFTTVEIILRTEPRAVVVPKDVVVSREGKPVLFVVGADDVAHQREVTVGVEQGNVVEIVRGVAAGQRVVRLGQYELADGAKVTAAAQGGKGKAGEP